MIRKTILGLAAAATLAAAMAGSASTASAHGYVHFGIYKPHFCKRVIVGFNYFGHPIWRCARAYHPYWIY